MPPSSHAMLAPTTNKLLGAVAALAVLPILGVAALLIYISMPSAQGGMEPTVATVCYIAFTVLFGAMIIVALNFSSQLNRQAKGQITTP